jgi:hypothetical protein
MTQKMTNTLLERPIEIAPPDAVVPASEVAMGTSALKATLDTVVTSNDQVSDTDRNLEGVVDQETEAWLQSIWDEYSYNPADEAQSLHKEARDQKHRASLQELSFNLESISGDKQAVMKDFISKFGIANFGRYDPDMLYNQYLSWQSGNMDGFDTLCIAAQRGDEGGAFDDLVQHIEFGEGNALIFESDGNTKRLDEIVRSVIEKGATIQATMLSDHGDYAAMPNLGLNVQANTKEFATSLRKLARGNSPVVILDSCFGGHELVENTELARVMSESMPGVYVLGPNKAIIDTMKLKSGEVIYDNLNPDTGLREFVNAKTGKAFASKLHGDLARPRVVAFFNGERVENRGSGFTIPKPRLRSTIKNTE